MHVFRTIVRVVAILLGWFLMIGGLVDLAGLIPAVDDAAFGFVDRLKIALPLLLAGIVLAMPHRLAMARLRYIALFAAQCLLGAICAYRLLQTVALVRHGDIAPVAIVVALVFVAVPFANAWALRSRRRTIA